MSQYTFTIINESEGYHTRTVLYTIGTSLGSLDVRVTFIADVGYCDVEHEIIDEEKFKQLPTDEADELIDFIHTL